MPEEVAPQWNVTRKANVILVAILLAMCLFGILVSVFGLFIPNGLSDAKEIERLYSLNTSPGFSFLIDEPLEGMLLNLSHSPKTFNITIRTSPYSKEDIIEAYVASENKILIKSECPSDQEKDNYTGATSIRCEVLVPYTYNMTQSVSVFLYKKSGNGEEYKTQQKTLSINWSEHERSFWYWAIVLSFIAFLGLGVLALVSIGVYKLSLGSKHQVLYAGEYSSQSVLHPLGLAKTPSQILQAFISSSLFWAIELTGVILLVVYLAFSSDSFNSSEALFAFLISGLFSLVVPFLWTALVWFADYKEREPIRIIASLFLWGAFAGLISIGANSLFIGSFGALGIGFLAAALIAPLVEELSKGTGLALFSLHHEYNDVVDGIVYGFAIGMGFSFVEDWLYLLSNPLGASIEAWAFLFILRSILFSATHGVFTALTGAAIGYLKQKKHPYATLGLLPGVIPAMLMHAIHNSGPIWVEFFGKIGAVIYFLLVIFFDYGGLVLVTLIMILGIYYSKRKPDSQPTPGVPEGDKPQPPQSL